MSASAALGAIGQEQMLIIAGEVFTALVDGDEGFLMPWSGDAIAFDEPISAWVDMEGGFVGRALLTTEMPTAHALARALLAMGADDPVSDGDLVDAFGEVANVVGGNVKALLPVSSHLHLPQVAEQAPPLEDGVLRGQLDLDWRGHAIVITLWSQG